MVYEQHEWVNGETITAKKLNNIEEGIVEASQSGGGSDTAWVTITYSGFSASHGSGLIAYAKFNGEDYDFASPDSQTWYLVGDLTIVQPVAVPPQDSGVVAVFVEDKAVMNDWDVVVSGDISADPITVWNESWELKGYVINGTGNISVYAL